jgi:dTDP-4-dehydrorhamnose reductase
MSLVVVGATGMLGAAVMAEARQRKLLVTGAARRGADVAIDLTNATACSVMLKRLRPQTIINCAALTDLRACAEDPNLAFLINAQGVSFLAEAAAQIGARLVHVSTDHFFTGDGALAHREDAAVSLVNDYARSKHAGETFALNAPRSLVVRTNVTGRRGSPGRPTFFEWALSSVNADEQIVGFDDYFTSTIDAGTLAEALLDLAGGGAEGRLNVSSRHVSSKLDFLRCLARAAGRADARLVPGSVRTLVPRRAESCGLDVTRASALLGRSLPDLDDVIQRLLAVGEAPTSCAS